MRQQSEYMRLKICKICKKMVEKYAEILYNENRVAYIFEIKNRFTEKSKIRIKKRKIDMLN